MTTHQAISRRNMLRRTALTMGTLGGGVAAHVASRDVRADTSTVVRNSAALGRREVWVATFCQEKVQADRPETMIRKVIDAMEEVAPLKPDIICLPEAFHVANLSKRPSPVETTEEPLGRYTGPISKCANQHGTNIICPIYTTESDRIYNSAVVIDRRGKMLGEYRKINPTEGELEAGITPGPVDPPVFQLDCATIGIQICFDVNWPQNWQKLAEKAADVVFWPSAFAGGQMLNALALLNRYYVVSSTRIRGSTIVDPLGCDVESTGRFGTWVCRPLNLDYAVIQGWQDIGKLDGVLAKYGRDVSITTKHTEALSLFSSLSPEHSASDILREFGIETSHRMLRRNTILQDQRRPA